MDQYERYWETLFPEDVEWSALQKYEWWRWNTIREMDLEFWGL